MKLIKVKFKKGEDCFRCGESKKDLKKEYHDCSVYGTFFGRHLFKANS